KGVEVVTAGEDLRPVTAFAVDDGDAVDARLVVVHVGDEPAVGRDAGRRRGAEGRRQWTRRAAGERGLGETAGVRLGEDDVAAGDGEVAATVADLGAHAQVAGQVARRIEAGGAGGDEDGAVAAALEPDDGLAVVVPGDLGEAAAASERLGGDRAV